MLTKMSKIITIICFCGFMACQKDDSATLEIWSEEESCANEFETLNNALSTAPFVGNSVSSGLTKGDKDYWQLKIAPNAKGILPTHLVYQIAKPSTVEVNIFRADTLYRPPKFTQTFRGDVREKVAVEDLKVDEKVVVQIRHLAGASTCYTLRFE
jgi:hypothetical protein